jgi:hypothetical protein
VTLFRHWVAADATDFARRFTGSTNVLSRSASAAVAAAGSIFMRMKPHWSGAGDHVVTMYGQSSGTKYQPLIQPMSSDGNYYVGFGDGGITTLMQGSASGHWTAEAEATLIYDWDTGAPAEHYYIGNVQKASRTSSIPRDGSAYPLTIGNFNSAFVANADIRQFARFNYVLSSSDRAALESGTSPAALATPPVEFYTRMEESPVPDELSALELTVTGTAVVGGVLPERVAANDATLTDGCTWVDVQNERALRCPASDYAHVADNAIWTLGDFTIIVRFVFNSLSGQPGILSHSEGSGFVPKWVVNRGHQTSGAIDFYFYNGSVQDTIASNTWTPVVGEVYAIGFKRSGSSWTAYRDGPTDGAASESQALADAAATLKIGWGGESFFDSDVSIIDVRMYDSAESDANILAAMIADGGTPARRCSTVGDKLSRSADTAVGTAGTIFCRFRPRWSSGDGAKHCAFDYGQESPTESQPHLLVNYTSNLFYVGFYDNGNDGRMSGSSSGHFTANKWVTLLYDWNTGAPAQHYYVGNSLKASSTGAITAYSGTAYGLVLGNNVSGGEAQLLGGDIMEFARFDYVLSSGQRAALEAGDNPLTLSPPPVEYYEKFDESPVPDEQSALTLTATGTAVVAGYHVDANPNVVITPSAGLLSITGQTSEVSDSANPKIRPAVAALTLTLTLPVVEKSDTDRAPAKGTLTLQGAVPTIRIAKFLTPSTGILTLIGSPPTVRYAVIRLPAAGALSLTGYAADLTKTFGLPVYWNVITAASFPLLVTWDVLNPLSIPALPVTWIVKESLARFALPVTWNVLERPLVGSGIAVAGGAQTITLAVGDVAFIGALIIQQGETGVVAAYDPVTRVATMVGPWAIPPTTGTSYEIRGVPITVLRSRDVQMPSAKGEKL